MYLEGRRDDDDDADADDADDGCRDVIGFCRGSCRCPKAFRCASSQSTIACSRYTCQKRI